MNIALILHDSTMTSKKASIRPLHADKNDIDLFQLKTIAFTHKNTPIKELNRFFLHEENRKERLEYLRFSCDLDEIFYVATCNRIEFFFTTDHVLDKSFLKNFYKNFRTDWDSEEINFAITHGDIFEGEEALRHIYHVASSLDSLVIGEREIITQVRKAYDLCKNDGLTGDVLRLVVKSTITTAKQIYTETKIANNPVSVVSLAERKLRELKLEKNVRILLVGAGETNTNISKYLIKQGFSNFTIFNRSIENAQKLVKVIGSATVKATAFTLDQLATHKGGFDVLITCTSSPDKIISPELFQKLVNGDTGKKVIVDLSVPSNIHNDVLIANKATLIDISELKEIATSNLEERKSEYIAAEQLIEENIINFRQLFKTRTLELKMKNVPEKIREIKEKAMSDVFAEEIKGMDDRSRELLSRVMDYMEKKCISVPMVMAKEIILESNS